MNRPGVNRLWELDFLRGTAIVSMVVLHAWDDLVWLKGEDLLKSALRCYWQKGTAVLFLIIFGVAGYLSYCRNGSRLRPEFKKCWRRGAMLFGWGLIISLVTAIFLKEGFVIFGILHLMGVGSILLYPCLPLKIINLALGAALILAGYYLNEYRIDFVWLVWMGFIPKGFHSVDYFPLIPWFGYILTGIALGGLIYPNGNRTFYLKDYSKNLIVNGVCLLGRKSLLIYLVHQPLLLTSIYLINWRFRIG